MVKKKAIIPDAAKVSEVVDLVIVYKPIKDLKPAEYNPRKRDKKAEADILESLQKYGWAEPAVVNMFPGRENVIIGGHQRVDISMKYFPEWVKVPCVEKYLTLEQEKELNLRLNKNTGEWDLTKLLENFETEFLLNVGFEEFELKQDNDPDDPITKEMKKHDNSNVPMPLVPKYTEKYGAVVIFYENELDETWLRNVLQLQKAKDYKNTRVMISQVMRVKDFQKVWDENEQRIETQSKS